MQFTVTTWSVMYHLQVIVTINLTSDLVFRMIMSEDISYRFII